jgi:hypothetical protein
MDKLYLLFQNDKSVREVVEIPIGNNRVQLIGVSRYTDFDENLTQEAGKRGYQFNGAYPLLHDGNFNALYGKTMQLCDAMIGDSEQRAAFKALMKESLSDWYGKETGYTFKMTEKLVNLNK